MWWTDKWEWILKKYLAKNLIFELIFNAWKLIFMKYFIKDACPKLFEIVLIKVRTGQN